MSDVPSSNFLDRMMENAETDEQKKAVEGLMVDPPCAFPWEKVLVDQNGNVAICCLSSYSIGNVYHEALDKIWNGERVQRLRTTFLKHGYDSGTCSIRCPFVLDRVKRG